MSKGVVCPFSKENFDTNHVKAAFKNKLLSFPIMEAIKANFTFMFIKIQTF